jgi:hypothetical protein
VSRATTAVCAAVVSWREPSTPFNTLDDAAAVNAQEDRGRGLSNPQRTFLPGGGRHHRGVEMHRRSLSTVSAVTGEETTSTPVGFTPEL